ncbi:MAG: serine hydrolase [Thermoleophilia bacterium]|nr:serine hydrolase [Thermoleophilia bacterium]
MPRGRLLLLVFVMMVLAAALTSCGGNETVSAVSSTVPDVSADPEDVLRECTSDQEDGLPGVVVGVIKDGGVVCEAAAGVRMRGNSEPVTISDSFHIGSNTKAMTALLCGILIDQRPLSWSSTVDDVLGPNIL